MAKRNTQHGSRGIEMTEENKTYSGLFEALSALQDAIEQPKKDASNPMFKSSYVTLDAVIASINTAKRKVGAKIFWHNEPRERVMWTVIDGYGEHLEIQGAPIAGDLGNRGTNSAQAEGSAETYSRRYSLSMVFGIASDVDDDGNTAPKGQPKTQDKPKNQLNSIFGGVSKSFREKNSFSEEAMYQAISQQFNANINSFYAFNKLSDQNKEAVINWLRAGVN